MIREGRRWKIPAEVGKPEDGRYKSAESLLERIERKKTEFVVEYTYNSNAIEGNTLTLRETDTLRKSGKSSIFCNEEPQLL